MTAHHSVTVSHTFEAGHRLPHIPGKCQSLHGHSWRVEVTIAGPQLDGRGTLVMFGDLKSGVRAWIDEHFDHGMILGLKDPLLPVLTDAGKTFTFPTWPTVEALAEFIAHIVEGQLNTVEKAQGAYVKRVKLSETSTNSATWEASRPEWADLAWIESNGDI